MFRTGLIKLKRSVSGSISKTKGLTLKLTCLLILDSAKMQCKYVLRILGESKSSDFTSNNVVISYKTLPCIGALVV